MSRRLGTNANFSVGEFYCDSYSHLGIERFSTAHVRYIKINDSEAFRTKLQIFQDSFVSLNSQKRLEHKGNQIKYRSLTVDPLSHAKLLIFRTWAVTKTSWVITVTNYNGRKQHNKPTQNSKRQAQGKAFLLFVFYLFKYLYWSIQFSIASLNGVLI